jgi:hypothetical protein
MVTFLVALLHLFLFDKAPLDDMGATFTRTIFVAFPASFAATAVDFMKQGRSSRQGAPSIQALIGPHS